MGSTISNRSPDPNLSKPEIHGNLLWLLSLIPIIAIIFGFLIYWQVNQNKRDVTQGNRIAPRCAPINAEKWWAAREARRSRAGNKSPQDIEMGELDIKKDSSDGRSSQSSKSIHPIVGVVWGWKDKALFR